MMTTATRSWIGARIAARHRATIAAVGMLVAGFAIRLALLPLPGYDVEAYQTWARAVYEFGVTSAYRLDLEPWYNYPPGYLYVLWATARLLVALAPLPDWGGPLLAALLKLPAILADVLAGGAIFLFLRRRARPRWAVIAALAYLFNPGVIWNTAYWGGMDALHTLLLLLALMAASAGRAQLSWPLVCCSLLVKPLGAPGALVVAVAALLHRDARRALVGAAAALGIAALAALPFLLAGRLGDLLTALTQNVGNYPALSANAHNVWWLISGGDVWRDDGLPALGALSYRGLGFLLFGLASLLTLARLRRKADAAALFAVGAALQLNLFVWPTEVHENWSHAALPLLAVAAALRPGLRPAYVLLTLTFLTNLALQDRQLESLWDSWNQAGWIDALKWVNALAYVALSVWVIVSVAAAARGASGQGEKGEKANLIASDGSDRSVGSVGSV